MPTHRNMGTGKIDQLALRRIKAEYFSGLDPAQIALFLYNERKPYRYTLMIEKVLSEAKLRNLKSPFNMQTKRAQ